MAEDSGLEGAIGSDSPWEIADPDGTVFKFHSLHEVSDFVVKESERWQWARTPGNTQPVIAIQDALNSLRQAAKQLTGQNPLTMPGPTLRGFLERYISFRPTLHGRAPLQGFLHELAQRDPHQAVAALGWVLRDEGRIKSNDGDGVPAASLASGITQAVLWKRGLVPDSQAMLAAGRLEDAARAGDAARDRLVGRSAEVDSLVEKLHSFSGETHAKVGTLSASVREEVDKALEGLRNDWANLTKTYDDKLALSAPSNYWSTKASTHHRSAKAFAIWSASFAVVGALLLSVLMAYLFRGVGVNQLPSWGQVLPTVIGAVIYLWTLKSLLRLTMSHVHLSLDSAERRVMIMSYLALSRRREVSAEERTALFAAIFRPSGDGIVKDETPPLPLWELLKGGRA